MGAPHGAGFTTPRFAPYTSQRLLFTNRGWARAAWGFSLWRWPILASSGMSRVGNSGERNPRGPYPQRLRSGRWPGARSHRGSALHLPVRTCPTSRFGSREADRALIGAKELPASSPTRRACLASVWASRLSTARLHSSWVVGLLHYQMGSAPLLHPIYARRRERPGWIPSRRYARTSLWELVSPQEEKGAPHLLLSPLLQGVTMRQEHPIEIPGKALSERRPRSLSITPQPVRTQVRLAHALRSASTSTVTWMPSFR
jgi:hypothetical protein